MNTEYRRPATPPSVLEEALDCVLTRVRWYTVRNRMDSLPEATKLAFNRLCDVLAKPDKPPWRRIR
jgi:hypothetical protein